MLLGYRSFCKYYKNQSYFCVWNWAASGRMIYFLSHFIRSAFTFTRVFSFFTKVVSFCTWNWAASGRMIYFLAHVFKSIYTLVFDNFNVGLPIVFIFLSPKEGSVSTPR